MTEAKERPATAGRSESETVGRERIAQARVLVGGTGNVGSQTLGPLIAAGFRRFVFLDRDRVEAKNLVNQAFSRDSEVGRAKAEVLAERARAAHPDVEAEAIVADLEDVPLGVLEGVDIVLGGLDSLRARQALITERAYPLGVTAVDGAVDTEGWIGKVQVLVPGAACCECPWDKQAYRQVGRETPCRPGGGASGPPTGAPAALGAAVADAMVREAVALIAGPRPAESYEILFDLESGRRFTSRLKRAARCRFDHVVVRERIGLQTPFAAATVGDLLATVRGAMGVDEPVRMEFRRRLFDVGLFRGERWLDAQQLAPYAGRRLGELGLTRLDRVRVQSGERCALVDLNQHESAERGRPS